MSLYDLDIFVRGVTEREERHAKQQQASLAKLGALLANVTAAANGAKREVTNAKEIYDAWTGDSRKSLSERWAGALADHEERIRYESELSENGEHPKQ